MTLSVESLLALASALVVLVAWLVRLEGIARQNARDLEKYEKLVEQDFRDLREDFRDFRGGPMRIERLPSRGEGG